MSKNEELDDRCEEFLHHAEDDAAERSVRAFLFGVGAVSALAFFLIILALWWQGMWP